MVVLALRKEVDDMPHVLVCFGKIALKPQYTFAQVMPDFNFKNALKEVLTPNEIVNRYNRDWRFSLPKTRRDFLLGKLGYVSAGMQKVTGYDETKKDFVEQLVDSKQSNYIFWAIHLPKQIMAFETKPPDIRYTSVMGTLKSFLDKRPDIGLTVESMVETRQFFEWVDSVERVINFKANLRSPNPDFSEEAKFIREMLETTNADTAKVELSKTADESSESLNIQGPIADIVNYGKEGYASFKAKGVVNKKPTVFDSGKKFPAELIDIPEGLDDNARWGRIMSALEKFNE